MLRLHYITSKCCGFLGYLFTTCCQLVTANPQYSDMSRYCGFVVQQVAEFLHCMVKLQRNDGFRLNSASRDMVTTLSKTAKTFLHIQSIFVRKLESIESHKNRATSYQQKKGKGSPYSISEHRVLELIPVLGSQRWGRLFLAWGSQPVSVLIHDVYIWKRQPHCQSFFTSDIELDWRSDVSSCQPTVVSWPFHKRFVTLLNL